MSAAIRGSGRSSLLSVVPTASSARGGGTTSALAAVPGYRGWWYALPTEHQNGGIWENSEGQATEVLPWCPEVVARLAALNAEGIYHSHVFVVRVKRQLALLYDRDLTDGNGWEQFTAIDLWESLALRAQLADIVRDQARKLPRILLPEENQ